MRVEAAQDKALADVGYLGRKQTGMGFYMDGKHDQSPVAVVQRRDARRARASRIRRGRRPQRT